MTGRGKWALLLAGAAVLVAAALPGTIETLRNGEPTSLTLEEYVRNGSRASGSSSRTAISSPSTSWGSTSSTRGACEA